MYHSTPRPILEIEKCLSHDLWLQKACTIYWCCKKVTSLVIICIRTIINYMPRSKPGKAWQREMFLISNTSNFIEKINNRCNLSLMVEGKWDGKINNSLFHILFSLPLFYTEQTLDWIKPYISNPLLGFWQNHVWRIKINAIYDFIGWS